MKKGAQKMMRQMFVGRSSHMVIHEAIPSRMVTLL